MKSGIYQIILKDGRFYIGSSINIEKRWYNHLYQLKNGIHPNVFIQRIYDKYGEAYFAFKVMLICSEEDLLFYEQQCITKLDPPLNLCKIAGRPYGWA